MKIAIISRARGHQLKAALRFRDGLARHGIQATIDHPTSLMECDLYVFWGHRRGKAMKLQRRLGRRYLVMERAYLGDRMLWTSLGYDGLNGHADFCNECVNGDRLARYFPDILKPWKQNRDGYALILGQVRGDASIRHLNFERWANDVAERLRRIGRDVKFRPHPKDIGFRINAEPLLSGSLLDALDSAAFTVTWNSNSGVDAVCAGVPTVTYSRGAMAWAITSHNVTSPLVTPDRQRWAERLAWCQWLPDEISSGEAWEHLKQGIDI